MIRWLHLRDCTGSMRCLIEVYQFSGGTVSAKCLHPVIACSAAAAPLQGADAVANGAEEMEQSRKPSVTAHRLPACGRKVRIPVTGRGAAVRRPDYRSAAAKHLSGRLVQQESSIALCHCLALDSEFKKGRSKCTTQFSNCK